MAAIKTQSSVSFLYWNILTPLVTSMSCVTISCPEPEQLISLMTDACGWEIYCESALDSNVEKMWGIAPVVLAEE